MARKMKTMDGNQAAAHAYPLVPLQATHFPSSEIIQTFTPVVRPESQCSANPAYRRLWT